MSLPYNSRHASKSPVMTMGGAQIFSTQSITVVAGAAALCATLVQYFSSKKSELYSELLCWLLLPILYRNLKQWIADPMSKASPFDKPTAQPTSFASLWIFALGITIACVSRAEISTLGFFPVLTPLLRIAQDYFASGGRPSNSLDPGYLTRSSNLGLSAFILALAEILVLFHWSLRGSATSLIPAVALFIVFLALIPKNIKRFRFVPAVDIEQSIGPLSSRIVFILFLSLGVETIIFGYPQAPSITACFVGVLKALSWCCMIRIAQGASWYAATSIATYGIIASRNIVALPSITQVLYHLKVAFVALGQVIQFLPKKAIGKPYLWALSLVFLVPFLTNLSALRSAKASTQSLSQSHEHPATALARSANSAFEARFRSQSKTYSDAYDEYTRRYNTKPPPGFEAWFNFAASHKSPIIDDFDTIYESISPYWKLTGKEVISMMQNVPKQPDTELWHCTFSGQQAKTTCDHAYRTYDRHISYSFDQLMEDLRGVVPDVQFLVNHLDEPTVLLPRDASGDIDILKGGKFNLNKMPRQPIWDTITRYCSSRPSQRNTAAEHDIKTHGLPFVKDHQMEVDLCQHPEYKNMHGFFMSPVSFRLIEGLVPILSTGSPSTMGDVLFPSPAYIEYEFQYNGTHDIDWEEKRKNLYWAGSTTGGFAQSDMWQTSQRQRFVELAQNLKGGQHHYLREKGGETTRVQSSFFDTTLFDVAFTRIFQCEGKFCRDQRRHFHTGSWEDKDHMLQSQLVFDLDGNGISGRYYKLLASKSTPLKQTLFREWHDDRLVPWVHYIPISQSMEELPELVSFLMYSEKGQKLAQQIAEQGQEWFTMAFRKEDFTIYVYRLLLELARLQDPNRPALQ